MITEKKVTELSADELAVMLKEKRKAESDQRAKERKKYESVREHTITSLSQMACELEVKLLELKKKAFADLLGFKEMMLKYGTIRGKDKNKGSFEIKNDQYKIVFSHHVNKKFDERALLAESKLRDFMDGFIRARDQKTYALIKTLLERNPKTGDYDIDLINRLYTLENEFDDINWRDALRLFKESYNPISTAQYVRFFKMDTTSNTWVPVVLDFAKLSTGEPETKK